MIAATSILPVSTGWLIAGTVMLAGVIPLLWVCVRR